MTLATDKTKKEYKERLVSQFRNTKSDKTTIVKRTVVLRPKKLNPKISDQKPIKNATTNVKSRLNNNKQNRITISGKLIAEYTGGKEEIKVD